MQQHSGKFAIALAITRLGEIDYVARIESAVRRIRQFSDHIIVIIVKREAAVPEAIKALLEVSLSFVNIEVLFRDFGFNVSSLAAPFVHYQKVNKNCCGINEYIKLEIFNLPYERVLALDLDISLQKAPDVLFECDADFMYTAGPVSPLNAGVLVVRPSLQLYSHMMRTLQSVSMTYTQELCFEGLGCGPCVSSSRSRGLCHGQEGPQGFLHYYFVKRRDENLQVRKLSSCIFNYQNDGNQCERYWKVYGPPYLVHKGLAAVNTLLSKEPTRMYPTEKVCRADFWILGTRKGGTTALYTSMTQHPKLAALHIRGAAKDGEVFRSVSQLEYYNDAFSSAPNGSLVGDSAVRRLVTDADIISKTCGHKYTKFIILLRDPVERCHSQMLMRSRLGTNGMNEASNISEAILVDLRLYRVFESSLLNETSVLYPRLDLRLRPNNCIAAGLYYFHLKRWFFHLSVRNFLIFFTEEFQKHTTDMIRTALNFVGVSAGDCKNFTISVEKLTNNARSKQELLPHQILTPLLRRELEGVFAPYNALLETQIGRIPWKS